MKSIFGKRLGSDGAAVINPHDRSACGRLPLAVLAGSLLFVGCAGDLQGDPNRFTNAFSDGGTTASASGGSTSSMGGTAAGGTTGTGTGGSTGTPTGGGGSAVPPDDACVATVLSSKGCSTTCHSADLAPTTGANLRLDGTNLGARLSMTKATYQGVTNAGACVPNVLIIDPSNPSNSLLLKKITGTQACGSSMPPGGTLTGSDLQCIQDWIMKF